MLLLAALALAPGAAHAQAGADCDGPPGNPAPGTPEWHQRELDNAFCGAQRSRDLAANPAYQAEQAALTRRKGSPVAMDAFRDPEVLRGVRFRYQELSFTARDGQRLSGAIFRPCDGACRRLPRGLRDHKPPYPGVVVVHGGGATPDMYLWGSEALAEAGDMVLTFQVPGGGGGATPATSTRRTPSTSCCRPRGDGPRRERRTRAGPGWTGTASGSRDTRRAASGSAGSGKRPMRPLLFHVPGRPARWLTCSAARCPA
jgi:hypothetical protein